MSSFTTRPRFDDAFKDEVRTRLGDGLIAMINRDVPLRRSGNMYVACCPFHKEATPSFKVLTGRRGWHFACWGCGANGDCFDWMMKFHNMEFPEAVERLAGEVGMEMPGVTPEQKAREQHLDRVRRLAAQISGMLTDKLYQPQGEAALSYLRSRGITDAEIKTFRLGYAPGDREQWRELIGAIRHCGFSSKEMADSGAFRMDEKGALFPVFLDRVMFTIHDDQGRPIAFAGRRMGDGDSAKYINSPDTALFTKGNVVYNAHRARKQAAESGRDVRVAEGYTDVIAMERHGLGPVVCCMGTAFTKDQAEGVWRLGKRLGNNSPVFCFDGDDAGSVAAVKAARVMLPLVRPDRTARFCLLSKVHDEAHDPASLLDLPDGVHRMEGALSGAVQMSVLLFDSEVAAVGRADSAEAEAALRHRLRAVIKVIEDKDMQRAYSGDFKVRLDRLKHPERYPDLPPPPGRLEEAALLAALLNHPDLAPELIEHVGGLQFTTPELERARHYIVGALREARGEAASVAQIIRQSGEYRDNILVDAVVSAHPFCAPTVDWDDVMSGSLAVVRRLEVERVIGDVERLMPTLVGTAENEAALLRMRAVLERYRPAAPTP